MFDNNNVNLINIDLDSKPRNQKIFCVLCNNEKIQLECINYEENRYKCPRCKNTYQPNFEILPSEDELISSHDSEAGPVLMSAPEEDEDGFKSKEDNDTSKSDIKLRKYLKDSETTTITYFRED